VAVVDTCSSRQRLLAATLYAMGCRVLTVTCDSLAGPSVAAQIIIGTPDVIVWHIDSGGAGAPLQQLLTSDGLGGAGVVVTTSDPVEAACWLDAGPVQMLLAPFTPVGLMNAVGAAYEQRPHMASVS
jgi:hypothetical protein